MINFNIEMLHKRNIICTYSSSVLSRKWRFKPYTSFLLVALMGLLLSVQLQAQTIAQQFPIIPQPRSIEYTGDLLSFDAVDIEATVFPDEAAKLKDFFIAQGLRLSKDALRVTFNQTEAIDDQSEEAYQLVIDSEITITAATSKGAFYAIQSLKQLLSSKDDQFLLPYVIIDDAPAFKIRGFMHDNGRNFQSIDLLKEQIEILSQYKFNVFHWHLTDNPGWRLESKRYPQLQKEEVTSRNPGSYYTQEDFKELLRFCEERHITLIPELDIPGHTDAFRAAFNNASMADDGIQEVLLELIEELAGLADASQMPYIHLGTDEVRKKEEQIPEDYLIPLFDKIHELDREVVVWRQGIVVEKDSLSITQLWASHQRRAGHRFIDSRSNYINHLDPFTAATRLYFQQPCETPHGNDLALGGILCAWPDNKVNQERDVLKQNPIYPSMVIYSDAIWNGRAVNKKEFWANLPTQKDEELDEFKQFEDKLIIHRDRFFKGKEFPYLRQSEIKWKIIGPFDHQGNVDAIFEVEDKIKESYTQADTTYKWSTTLTGATIHFKHYFGFPAHTDQKSGTYYATTVIYSPEERIQDFWVGFHGWSRSGGRRGGPFPQLGQWHNTNPKLWVNEKLIPPPHWKQPGLGADTDETPFVDEDYFYRSPTKIKLKKGWNTVLIKVPFVPHNFKWMFSFIPLSTDGVNVSEVSDLIFDPKQVFNQ